MRISDWSSDVCSSDLVAANPDRRRLLKNGLLGLSILPFAGVLSACDDDEASATPTPGPTPTHTPPPSMSYDVNFTAVPPNLNDTVTVLKGYVAEALFKAEIGKAQRMISSN